MSKKPREPKKLEAPDDAIARMASQLSLNTKTRKERRAEINARYVERNPGIWHVYNHIIRPMVRFRARLFGTDKGGETEAKVPVFVVPKDPLLAEVFAGASPAQVQGIQEAL